MLQIIDYQSEFQPAFERLNRAWIEGGFGRLEEVDTPVSYTHLTLPTSDLV